MNADELDRKARLARFVAKLRRELVELGADERRVKHLSVQDLMVERARFTARELMGAPTGR